MICILFTLHYSLELSLRTYQNLFPGLGFCGNRHALSLLLSKSSRRQLSFFFPIHLLQIFKRTDPAISTMNSPDDCFNLHASGLSAIDVDDHSGDAVITKMQLIAEEDFL